MSRSFRHTPITGICCCESEKQDKRIHNRRYRRICKTLLRTGVDVLPKLRELTNIWVWGKDGRQYIRRNTILQNPSLMRK